MLEPTQQEKDLLAEVKQKWEIADRPHKRFRDKCDHLYGLWSGFETWKEYMAEANPRDRDVGLVDAKRQWGAELFIPIVFATVESVIPRMLSNRPKMLVNPAEGTPEQNAENMKYLIDRQQAQLDYELVLQDIAKDGQVYGLGVQKTYWKTERCPVPTLEPVTYDSSRYVPGPVQIKTTFDDPWAEAVDPRDFLWDPYGYDLRTCSYLFHRTWRPTSYVMKMIQAGAWLQGHDGVTVEDIRKFSSQRYGEVHAAQIRADGYPSPQGDQPHEVWEAHLDGERVVTVLDRELVVQFGGNPTPRNQYPFQVFRPSKRPARKMVGMGIVEPSEDLQREMNTMRSQRRDNATAVLQRSFFYQRGLLEPEDLKFGPATAIPVTGDPREVIMPAPVQDIPNSSYSEEDRLIADMARASGMDDSSQGLSVGQATATEVQYVQAAASLRIQMQTRRCEVEIIKGAAQQWVWMNQFKIREAIKLRMPVTQPSPDGPDSWWQHVTVTPAELAGDMVIDVDGGSTQPDNIAQKRNDGMQLWQMFAQNPQVNQQVLVSRVLDQFDVKSPNEWLQVAPHIPPAFLPLLERALTSQFHLDPAMIQALLNQVMQAASQQEQQVLQQQSGPVTVQSGPPPNLLAQQSQNGGGQ